MRTRECAARLCLIMLALAAVLVSCGKQPFKPAIYAPGKRFGIDIYQAWSHNGQFVVFLRSIADRNGPAGVYVVSAEGGTPRLLYPGDRLWPRDISTSPDDRYIAFDRAGNLFVASVDGATSSLINTGGDLIDGPEWSPTSQDIVYTKRGPVGVGLWMYNVSAGQETPLLVNGQPISGNYSTWSPDGQWIAMTRGTAEGEYLSVVSRDGATLRDLYFGGSDYLVYFPKWYVSPTTGERSIMFFRQGPSTGMWVIREDGSGLRPLELNVSWEDAFSPDFREVVCSDFDRDTLGVLFVRKTDDWTGASLRQLTTWVAPQP